MSPLCESGYCAPGKNGQYYICTDELVYSQKSPLKCTSNSDCTTKVDEETGISYQGTCQCSMNMNGDSYCSLLNGDKLNQILLKQEMKWYGSNAIYKCNTVERYPGSNCMMQYWKKTDVDKWTYYNVNANLYIDIKGAEDCVVETFYNDYMMAHKQHWIDETVSFGQCLAACVIPGYNQTGIIGTCLYGCTAKAFII